MRTLRHRVGKIEDASQRRTALQPYTVKTDDRIVEAHITPGRPVYVTIRYDSRRIDTSGAVARVRGRLPAGCAIVVFPQKISTVEEWTAHAKQCTNDGGTI
jgi:hypothetical protein